MATIKDVAELAGVSVGSVSRVFRRHPTVGSDLAAQVRKAAAELGYLHPTDRVKRPSGSTAVLRRLGLLTVGMAHSLSRLPVIARLLEGVFQGASDRGISVTVSNVPDLREVPALVRERQVDGFLVKAGLQGTAEEWQTPLIQSLQSLPFVWLLGRPNGCRGDMCGSDDAAVGRMAAEHLVRNGHRRLAYLNPKGDHQLLLDRQASFTWHAERLGAHVTPLLGRPKGSVIPVRPLSEVADVADLVDQLLALRERPTAVFVPADNMAALVYRALDGKKVKVGADLSVIGCNNEAIIREGLSPGLCTVDIHADQIGARGVDQLAWRLAHPEGGENTVVVAPDLIEAPSVRSRKP
jgi:LacI family transcriptional regulator